jgi:hypothetical protein
MVIKADKTLTNKWELQPEWYGNPELGYECWGKKYQDGSKVYVFGLKDKHKGLHEITDYHYVLRHSHSGMFNSDSSALEVMTYLDLRYKLGLLDSGKSLTETQLKLLKV